MPHAPMALLGMSFFNAASRPASLVHKLTLSDPNALRKSWVSLMGRGT